MNFSKYFKKKIPFCHKNIPGILAILVVIVLFVALPAFRHAAIYNLIPLCFIGSLIFAIHKYPARGSSEITITFIFIAAFFFSAYNLIHFGVRLDFDGKEYFSLGQSIASGNGFLGSTYREPLYPAIVGLFAFAGDSSGLWLAIFQHIVLVCCVPGIYLLARLCRFSELTGCIAAMFLALDSLLIQSTGFIMTEILFCAAILASTALLIRWYRTPTLRISICAGLMFAITSNIKQLFFPALIAGIVIMAVKRKPKGLYAGLIVIIAFAAGTAPWSIRNFIKNGNYAVSSSLGIQLFTKAITFGCIDTNGRYFKNIEQPLLNTISDLNINRQEITNDIKAYSGFYPKNSTSNPEYNWQINRIPHALMDSLKEYHGYSGFAASKLLRQAAIEGFKAHPVRYMKSIANSFFTLMFCNREIYPKAEFVLPVNTNACAPVLQRFLNSVVSVSGYILLLFPAAILLRRGNSVVTIVPFVIVCCMDLLIACVQIGFTRYAIPWEPFKTICAAYVVETIILAGNNIRQQIFR